MSEITDELRWHVARAISIPQHHTTWDLLTEREKDLFYMQADYAISAMSNSSPIMKEDVVERVARAIREASRPFVLAGNDCVPAWSEGQQQIWNTIARAAIQAQGTDEGLSKGLSDDDCVICGKSKRQHTTNSGVGMCQIYPMFRSRRAEFLALLKLAREALSNSVKG